ncbi:amidohydrolase [Cellulosimicrobium funkei]|nr:amidohydrolase [Cellulosimicrobium funkei]
MVADRRHGLCHDRDPGHGPRRSDRRRILLAALSEDRRRIGRGAAGAGGTENNRAILGNLRHPGHQHRFKVPHRHIHRCHCVLDRPSGLGCDVRGRVDSRLRPGRQNGCLRAGRHPGVQHLHHRHRPRPCRRRSPDHLGLPPRVRSVCSHPERHHRSCPPSRIPAKRCRRTGPGHRHNPSARPSRHTQLREVPVHIETTTQQSSVVERRPGLADLLITADTIETFDPANPTARAIAVSDGTIIAVGEVQDLEPLVGPETNVVEFGDAAVLPGLTDAHVHPIWGVTTLARGTDLTGVATLEEATRRLAATEPIGEQGWILGWGVDPNMFGTPMSGRSFAETLPGRPVYLRLRDAHSAIVSPRGIELAGITGEETFPDKSFVEVAEDGKPSGLLLELSAMALMDSVLPRLTFDETVQAVETQLHAMADVGLTGGHVMDFGEGSGEILKAIEARGDLPLRLRFSPMCVPGMHSDQWQELASMQKTGGRGWQIEGIKFFIDGTVDNGTAWLEHPDVYGENEESVWNDPQEYAKALRYFIQRGIPTATHAIGDAAVRHVLDAIESAGDARLLAPHRIEHIETVPDEIIDRFARLGVIASMQPVHATHHTLADGSDNWSVRLGPERAARGWRCRDLRNIGVTLALGSDWPVTPVDPRAMLADAQLRRPVERPHVAPVQPDQALTALQSYEGYTTHAARAAGHEKTRGAIKIGYVADLTVLAANPLRLSPEQQARNCVIATVVAGRVRQPRN